MTRLAKYFVFALLFVAASPLASSADTPRHLDHPIVAVISVAGYDALSVDLDMIGRFAEMPALRSMLEGGLAMAAGGNGIAAVDASRPWGAILYGQQLKPLVFIPATNPSSIINGITAITKEQATPVGDNLYSMKLNGMPILLRSTDDYVFASIDEDVLQSPPAEPGLLLEDLPNQFDAAVRIYWQHVPATYRNLFIARIRRSFRDVDLKAQESVGRFEARRDALKGQQELVIKSISEVERVTLGLSLKDSGETTLHAEFISQQDSNLADLLDIPTAMTRYSNFTVEDEISSFSFATGPSKKLADWLKNSLRSLVPPPRRGDVHQIARKNRLADRMIELITQTAREDGLDMTFSMDLVSIAEPVGVAAFHFSDTKKLQELVRESNKLPNSNSHQASEARIGKLPGWRIVDTETGQEVAFAFDETTVYAAIGNAPHKLLQSTLARTSSHTRPPSQEISAGSTWARTSISIYQAMKFGARSGDLRVAQFQPFLDQMANDGRVVLSIDRAERGAAFELTLEAGVLRTLSKAAADSFQRGMAGNNN